VTHSLKLDEKMLDEAGRAIGEGPVVMVNLLRFREKPDYPSNFAEAMPDARQGYYQGYVSGFRAACAEVGVTPEVVYVGARVASVLAGPDDLWDDIAIVRYPSFDDFRRIIATDTYVSQAAPHRLAALADWRFTATKAQT
jgi:hypothetical protein